MNKLQLSLSKNKTIINNKSYSKYYFIHRMRMLRTTIEEKYELIRKLSFITENYAINPWQYIKEYIKKGRYFNQTQKKTDGFSEVTTSCVAML